MSAVITRGTIFEDSGAFLMRRVTGNDGANIVQADVSSIAYSVYDKDDTSSASATGTLTVATVIFDTLQTDDRFSDNGGDSTGYNFGWESPASLYPDGDKVYLVEILFTPVTGEAWHVMFEIAVKAVLRS